MPLWTLVAASGLIAVIAGGLEYYKGVQPFLDLLEKRTYLYGYACDDPLENLRQHDPSARINVMEVDRALLHRWTKRWSRFRIAYGPSMEGDSDEDLELRLNQGVCGQAVSGQEFVEVDLENPNTPSYDLSLGQQQLTKDLKLILSMPIMKAKRRWRGGVTFTDEVIGVVNIDSKSKDAQQYNARTTVDGKSLLEKQEEELGKIGALCSYIMS